MKKTIITLLSILLLLSLCACSSGGNENSTSPSGSLEEMMTEIYKGIPSEELPMMLTNTVVDETTVNWFLGLDELNFEEALASESAVGSIAHSVVLVRAKSDQDVDALASEIKEKLQPNKWICVGSEEVVVERKGDILLVVLSDDKKDILVENFKGLK